jgi:uncharacterized protein (TIRG00374 family)
VLGLGLGIYAVYLVFGTSAELQGLTRTLDHLNWSWVLLAASAEVASFVSYAAMQRVLVMAGGVDISLRSLVWIALVSNTMLSSMPAGPVVSTAFVFRQFRRRGADEALAGWAAVASIIGGSVGLAILAAFGVAIAGGQGQDLDLVWVTVGVLVVMLFTGSMLVQRRLLVGVLARALGASQRLFKWPRGDLAEKMDGILAEVNLVSPSAMQLTAATVFSLLNWLFDCGCLVLSFLALGVGIPWGVLLLAYGASQLAASLPITPGGLGVVDGSLSIGLVAYGGDQASTVAVVLLYRIMSFWAQLPIGWGTWAFMAWRAKVNDALRLGSPELGSTEVGSAEELMRQAGEAGSGDLGLAASPMPAEDPGSIDWRGGR